MSELQAIILPHHGLPENEAELQELRELCLAAGGREVVLRPSGSMVVGSWICRTCDTDHGYSSCDNYDVDTVQFYVIVEGDDE